ncbi:TonB-dependent siderophore receptor [Paracoccus caeni]|uniref:TonB-dependent siderophore receptor n=1 Tax=Paracoccus caeni TaxID=657651 RepID=A0A934SL72_9RHOB|nr:TonB-dependent siderophore receptor [Paracoccus caeni]MBK4217129.1 TonB-dependent siderophore receptor [Paracoccus caeni]
MFLALNRRRAQSRLGRLGSRTALPTLALAGVVAAIPLTSEAQEGTEPIVLDQITLSADSATEGTGSYTSGGVSGSAAGLGLTARETPQSVTIITDQRIRDQGDETLNQVIDQTPGLTAMQGNGEMRWSYYARGSSVDNIQYDGVASYVHFYARDVNPQDDMAIYDRVEVVRGATGLLEGTGNPSASVNLVRKLPTADAQSVVETELSSFGNVRLSYDTSRPLSADGRVRGRFVASGVAGDGYRDNLKDARGILYGVVEADLSDATTLSLGLSHAHEKIDGYAWGGLWTRPDGSFYDFDGKTSPSLDWEFSDRKQTVGYLNLDHDFGNGWSLDARLRVSEGDAEMMYSYMRYEETGDLLRDGGNDFYINQSRSVDVRLSGPVSLFGRDHDFVIGVNGSRDRTRYDSHKSFTDIIEDPSVADPGSYPDPDFKPGSDYWDMVNKNYGIYASARWNLADTTKVITGARLAWYDYIDDASWGGSSFEVDSQLVPYLGVVHDLNDRVTVYGSYTGIFAPKSERGVDGQLDPVEGSNLEFGAKAEFLGGDLIASAAVFQTDQDGLPESDPDHQDCAGPGPTCSIAAGLIRTRGAEVELAGAINDRWNVWASYTYANSKYREGEKSGQRFNTATSPEHLLKLGATYDLAGALEGLTVGGSLRYQSVIFADEPGGGWSSGGVPYRLQQGGYTLVDLMARYDLSDQTSVQLNIDNLFDKTYYSAISEPGYGNFIGPERSVSLALRHAF